ncbi:MAG TPA: replicative DNA helicase [Gaiellaceae bacterium]|jgi:replicative DNA helicase|nr:replicative DNA helicase [Gaiellaceae bacterium]
MAATEHLYNSTDHPPYEDPGAGSAAGLVPPHSLEAERSVLGAILLSEKTHYAYVVEQGLRPDDFYRERHGIIYDSMLALFGAGEPIDRLTLVEHLRSRGKLEEVGGEASIDELLASVPSVGNLRQYGQIVKERSLLRRLLAASYEIQASVHQQDGDARDLIERAERMVLDVGHDDRQQDFQRVGGVLHLEIEKWQKLATEGQSITGTTSGYADLDALTGGFQPGNLIIIAARPSMGKSAFVTNVAENVALDKDRPRPVALFSLEMSEAELAQRFIASQAGIRGDDLRKGRLRDATKWKRVLDTANRYDSSPLFIDDSSDLGLLDIRAKCRRLHQQTMEEYGGLGLVIVDYLQLMRADAKTESRVLQVGEMSRGLKILARELEVPVIVLSQLNRGVEARTDKRPMLSDLRESGSIEQDADLCMFIYRDEYYYPDTTETPGEAELIIAKHRNGGLDTVRLTFQGEYPRFLGMARAA